MKTFAKSLLCSLLLSPLALSLPARGGDIFSSDYRTDSTLMQRLHNLGLPAYKAWDVTLYSRGKEKFDQFFYDIDHAQRKVWVEYFIFANDSIGHLTLQHLEAAARRGCEVRLVTDDYKDRARHYGLSNPATRDSIRALGIDFVLFDRYHYPWFNHVCRDHRKIVCIDDSIGYIGGLNVADYYLNGRPDTYGAWRDTHARLVGPAVEGLSRLFQAHYQRSGGTGKYSFHRFLFAPPFMPSRPTAAEVVYFERSRLTVEKQRETRAAIIAALDAARDTVRLVSPYLLPTPTVRRAIRRAIRRGVHVEVLFSKVGDSPTLSYGNYHFALSLVRLGAHVFLYRGAFHHSKILMVDGQVAMVGSANLNSRSLKWDYEASCFLFSPAHTAQLNQIFEQDKLQCDTLTPAYYHALFTPKQRRSAALIDRFLTPWL